MKIPYFYYPFLLTLYTSVSNAVDVQLGEGRAPKPGLNFIQLTYQQSKRGDYYAHGDKQLTDTATRTTQIQLRLGHAFKIGEYPAVFYVQAPIISHVQPAGVLSRFAGDSGFGDTNLVHALWPYANYDKHSYVGVAAYLTVPTGSYRPERGFNIGENRYRLALQVGYQTQWTERLQWMATVDTTWYGDNHEVTPAHYTLEQRPLYAGQTGWRYDFNTHYALGIAYFYSTGGETRINGVNRDDRIQLQRYQLSGIATFSFGRITLQYGSDLATENGHFEDQRWILRYSKSF